MRQTCSALGVGVEGTSTWRTVKATPGSGGRESALRPPGRLNPLSKGLGEDYLEEVGLSSLTHSADTTEWARCLVEGHSSCQPSREVLCGQAGVPCVPRKPQKLRQGGAPTRS